LTEPRKNEVVVNTPVLTLCGGTLMIAGRGFGERDWFD
jgi:hypothetical protein